jgi:hypothetical protein
MKHESRPLVLTTTRLREAASTGSVDRPRFARASGGEAVRRLARERAREVPQRVGPQGEGREECGGR